MAVQYPIKNNIETKGGDSMNRKIAIICLLIVIGGIVVLLLGCPPPPVRVRPPEPRVEVYGAPPYPDAVWRPGHWDYR